MPKVSTWRETEGAPLRTFIGLAILEERARATAWDRLDGPETAKAYLSLILRIGGYCCVHTINRNGSRGRADLLLKDLANTRAAVQDTKGGIGRQRHIDVLLYDR